MALTFRVMPTPTAGAVVDTAEEDISSYTAFKMGVKKWFDAALFQFDIDINTPDVDIDVTCSSSLCGYLLLRWCYGG